MSGKPWDMKSTHSLTAAAEWMRKQSDALVVVIVRPGDGALAADPLIDVLDVHDRLWDKDLPKLLAALKATREDEWAKVLKKEAKSGK